MIEEDTLASLNWRVRDAVESALAEGQAVTVRMPVLGHLCDLYSVCRRGRTNHSRCNQFGCEHPGCPLNQRPQVCLCPPAEGERSADTVLWDELRRCQRYQSRGALAEFSTALRSAGWLHSLTQ